MASRARQLRQEPMTAGSIRDYVEKYFSVSRMVDDYHRLYASLIAGRSAHEPESAVA
jgi:hypothetical protein